MIHRNGLYARFFPVAVRSKFHSGHSKLHTGHSKLHLAWVPRPLAPGPSGEGEGPGAKGRGDYVKHCPPDALSSFHEKKLLNFLSACALRSSAMSCCNFATAPARRRKPPLFCRSPSEGSTSSFTVISKPSASARPSSGRPNSQAARGARLGPSPSRIWSCGCSGPDRPALIA